MSLWSELVKQVLPLLQDEKKVALGLFLAFALVMLATAHKLSKKTTDDFKAAEKRIWSERPPAQDELTVARLKLELQTLHIRTERAEWASKEWQLQGVKLQTELDRVSSELSAARGELQTLQLEREQKEERFRASETTERVKIPPLLRPQLAPRDNPALVALQRAKPSAPKKKPRQET